MEPPSDRKGARAREKDTALSAQPPAEATGGLRSPKNPALDDAIGDALQAHFRALTEAPLPDRLRDLLAQLEARGQDDK